MFIFKFVYIILLYNVISDFVTRVRDNNLKEFDEKTIDTVASLVISIINAQMCISQINPYTPEGQEILTLDGMTGTRTRHLYNNICKNIDNVRYLEIGTWNGSSSVSAVYKNKIKAFFIDDWSQFGGNCEIFKQNMNKFNTDSEFELLESDCWKVDLSKISFAPFNVYLYDGEHSELSQFKALEYYLPVLDSTFIFLVNDWNWPNVRDGTMRAIRELNLNVVFRHEIFVGSDECNIPPMYAGVNTWWNGCGIFILRKN